MKLSLSFILTAFLMSGLKLLITPSGMAMLHAQDLDILLEIAILSSLGASFSSIIFFFLGKRLDDWLQKFQSKKQKRINFKRNRKIVKIKNRFGSFGLSMSIGILSVPIGSLLVGRYFSKDKRAILSLVSASIIWSFGLTYISALFTNVIKPILN